MQYIMIFFIITNEDDDVVYQVVPTITKIEGDNVYFSNGKMNRFDAIIFATGYKSTVLKWLKVQN